MFGNPNSVAKSVSPNKSIQPLASPSQLSKSHRISCDKKGLYYLDGIDTEVDPRSKLLQIKSAFESLEPGNNGSNLKGEMDTDSEVSSEYEMEDEEAIQSDAEIKVEDD